MTTTDAFVERARALDSTVLSDALDGLGLPAGLGGLAPTWGAPRFVGRARTVSLESDVSGAPGPHLATSVVADAAPGEIVVMANGGRRDASCWGGILSLGSVQRGVVGVVADGVCRDVAEAEELALPVYARGTSPRTARGRLRQCASDEPVLIDDVTVRRGDLVLADDSGVVVVPAEHVEEVLSAAEAIASREAAIAAEVRAGVPIHHAMHDARLAGSQDR